MRTGLTVARVRRLLPAWNGALRALGVSLNVLRNRLCWPAGIVSALLYGWIFWRVRLYSGMVLQCAYIALETVGWRRSSIQHASHRDVSRRMHVMPIPRRMCVLGLLCGAAGSVALGALTAQFADAALPWLDATRTSFSLVAEFWKTRRYIAQWRLWIAVNCAYVVMFAFENLPLTAALYAGFIVLSYIGLRDWKRDDSLIRNTSTPTASQSG